MNMFQLRCPNCDAVLEIKDDLKTHCRCRYCGTEILLNDQQDSVINARVRLKELEHKNQAQIQQLEHEKYKIDKEYEEKDKERKDTNMSAIIAIVIGILVLVFCFAMIFTNGTLQKIIPVPYSASDFCKMDLDNAVTILESAGYKNITTVEQTASGLFKSKEPNRVNSISIDGKKNFRSGKEFRAKSEIIITYNGG